MGYYSDVAMRLEPNTAKGFSNQWLLEDFKKAVGEHYDYIKPDEIKEDDYGITMRWYGVKWYDSFPEVQAACEWFEKFADELEVTPSEEATCCGICGVEIGEELTDVTYEDRGILHTYLGVHRCIEEC